jgi:hypothetical protein
LAGAGGGVGSGGSGGDNSFQSQYSSYHSSYSQHDTVPTHVLSYIHDTEQRKNTSHLSWMEKLFSKELRNNKDWKNFKNVQKHLSAATINEIQICFELSINRFLEMSFDDRENHCAQELIEYLQPSQLNLLFPLFFDNHR